MSRTSRITIRDVAAEAGVSHQTVSRVINQSGLVSVQTRQQVETAIAQLGYQPNAVARSMARGRTGVVACIAPNLTDYTFASIIHGAQMAARESGYFLLAATAVDTASFTELVDQLLGSGLAEGLMVIDPYVDEMARAVPTEFPLVFAGGGAHGRHPMAHSVVMDDENAAVMATTHLLTLGHRRVACVTGPATEKCTQMRTAGFRRALRAAGVALNGAWLVEGDWSAESGYAAFAQLWGENEQVEELPTAVFAQNDQMAVGLLRAARDHGLYLPQQLAVIGIDDIPLAAYFAPPLTTIHQNFTAIGREAIRLLLHAIAQPDAPAQHLQLPAHLIQRRSTTPYEAETTLTNLEAIAS
jgi:DNA-binding LacI/PurR family transcriptional regulator